MLSFSSASLLDGHRIVRLSVYCLVFVVLMRCLTLCPEVEVHAIVGRAPSARFSGTFSPAGYAAEHPDIAGIRDPIEHYITEGYAERRVIVLDNGAKGVWSESGYFALNRDMWSCGKDSFLHWSNEGRYEGRTIVVTPIEQLGRPEINGYNKGGAVYHAPWIQAEIDSPKSLKSVISFAFLIVLTLLTIGFLVLTQCCDMQILIVPIAVASATPTPTHKPNNNNSASTSMVDPSPVAVNSTEEPAHFAAVEDAEKEDEWQLEAVDETAAVEAGRKDASNKE